jgi:DNA-binding Xre family transcriptional regulator
MDPIEMSPIELEAVRFMEAVDRGDRELELRSLRALLSEEELEELQAVLERMRTSDISRSCPKVRRISPIARLQLVIGLGHGTVSEQVRETLRREMADRGWDQQVVARLTGITQGQISRFLKGGVVKTPTLDRLGQFLRISIDSGMGFGCNDNKGTVYNALR